MERAKEKQQLYVTTARLKYHTMLYLVFVLNPYEGIQAII